MMDEGTELTYVIRGTKGGARNMPTWISDVALTTIPGQGLGLIVDTREFFYDFQRSYSKYYWM